MFPFLLLRKDRESLYPFLFEMTAKFLAISFCSIIFKRKQKLKQNFSEKLRVSLFLSNGFFYAFSSYLYFRSFNFTKICQQKMLIR